MKNKKITISIDGRVALPVRAIPYATGGWLSAEDVAKNLARKVGKSFAQLQNLSAYHLVDGEPIQVLPKEWDAVAARLDGLEADLRSQFPNDDQGYAAWLSKSVALLPDGVFVWLDEFENDFFEDFSEDRVEFVDEREGERAISYMPMMSDEERAIVLADFGALQFSVDDTQTIANDEGVAGLAELIYNGEPIDWEYWANRQTITPQQAARLAGCIDPIRWPGDQFKQGQMPDELRIKIQRLSEWLNERNQAWTLSSLVKALGVGLAPVLMKQAVQESEQASNTCATEQKGNDEKQLPTGVPSSEILHQFKLDDAWADKLRHVDRNPFLKAALLRKGCRKSGKNPGALSLWNPVKFGEILIKRDGRSRVAVARIIENRFPKWHDEWDAAQSIDETADWDSEIEHE